MGWPRFMASNWALRWMMFPTPRPKPQSEGDKKPSWVYDREPWEPIPRWHPMRLLGYDMRYVGYNWTGEAQWVYGHSQQVARGLLEKEYSGPPSDNAGYEWTATGNDGHGNL